MSIQTSGTISVKNIRDEFGGPNVAPISLYYRGGTFVKNSTSNIKIPMNGPIKWSDFYGAKKYIGSVSITVYNETVSQYGNSNNGQVVVTVSGSSSTYVVTVEGRSPAFLTSGQTTTATGFDSSASPRVTIQDEAGTYFFGPFGIGYGSGSQSFSYNL